MAKVSIIIRSYNESKWIEICIDAIKKQIFKDYEIILVDNNSTDDTVKIAKRIGNIRILYIDNFKPGLAINYGVKNSIGKYIVCLSAHCIPTNKNWLNNLVKTIENKKNIAGAYDRQIPLSYSSDSDKRDLLITFGKDKRIQTKDTFFHNANSIIPRKIWNKFKFDEKANNIEDRIWAKKVISKGLKIIYEPEAVVYHHHGIHHNNDKKRANQIISILNKIDQDSISKLPNALLPSQNKLIALIPINRDIQSKSKEITLINNTLRAIKESKYIKSIFIISDRKLPIKNTSIKYLDRKKIIKTEDVSLESVLLKSLIEIESNNIFPRHIIYFNHDYIFRPKKFLDSLILKFFKGGYDTVFPAINDYGHYWLQDKNAKFKRINSSFKSRETKKRKNLKALYGLGLITSSYLLKKKTLFGKNIGVEILEDKKYLLRLRDFNNLELFS